MPSTASHTNPFFFNGTIIEVITGGIGLQGCERLPAFGARFRSSPAPGKAIDRRVALACGPYPGGPLPTVPQSAGCYHFSPLLDALPATHSRPAWPRDFPGRGFCRG